MSQQKQYLDILNRTGGKRIAVIGDVMLDRSIFGAVERLSAEAPIPIIDVTGDTDQLGGAANVVNNLNALGEEPVLFSVIGDDSGGQRLRDLLGESVRGEQFVLSEAARPTTVKLRLFGQNRLLARADFESRAAVREETWRKLAALLEENAPSLAAVIIEDYNKGLLPEAFIRAILEIAGRHALMVLVDPKSDNFFAFEGAALFKPNLRETAQALGHPIDDLAAVEAAAHTLAERMGCENIMVTLGKDGVGLLDGAGVFTTMPAFVRVVNDPAGAGDTVISVMASMMVAGASAKDAAVLANYGGGLICEKVGVQPITPEELRDAVLRHGDGTGPNRSA